MKSLFLMRHGRSPVGPPGSRDKDRVLDSVGRAEVRSMGRRLQALEAEIDWVGVSSAARAQETFAQLSGCWGASGVHQVEERLYLAQPSTYFDLFLKIPAGVERVLMIGHNPGISELIAVLTGTVQMMSTAALVRIELKVPEFAQINEGSRGQIGATFLPD